jgi:UDP:flavonoid glycosyltransferase YjiC (YdhE family)
MNTRKPVVLLAPLDWGLGHTVRCIPIIKELLAQGCEVLVACNSMQKLILVPEFPSVRFVRLEGYGIYYGKSRVKTLFNLFLQIPKILTRINGEQTWLKNFLIMNPVDAIISDNRYGFFSPGIPCIFITHQLSVRSGLGNVTDNLVQKRLYSFINKFSVCWVPDWESPVLNAGGRLSHPKYLPSIPVTYIGCLSRFEKCTNQSKTTDLLVILSGPEPQRGLLENILIDQLKTFPGTGVFVRGTTEDHSIASFNNITVLNYLSGAELNTLMCNSAIVICRAGYTSVMDILKLGKKAILIPTPGQAEQEYLAMYLHQKKLAVMSNQKRFSLETVLEMVNGSSLEVMSKPMDRYRRIVQEFSHSLKSTGSR